MWGHVGRCLELFILQKLPRHVTLSRPTQLHAFIAMPSNLTAIAAFMFTVFNSHLSFCILPKRQTIFVIHGVGCPSSFYSELTLQHDSFSCLFVYASWSCIGSIQRTRRLRILQESECDCPGYYKHQHKAIQNITRIRTRPFRISQVSEQGHSEYHKNQNKAIQNITRIRTRPFRTSKVSKKGHSEYHKNQNEAIQNITNIRTRPIRISQGSERGHSEYQKYQNKAIQNITNIRIRPLISQ